MSGKLLDLTGEEMMSEIGKGRGMTGSGTVAILSAISSAQLLLSVCKLTLAKESYKGVHNDMEEMIERIDSSRLPLLRKILDSDVSAVSEMIACRIKRDKETDPQIKEQYQKEALNKLEDATDSVLDLCDVCMEIIPMGLFICKMGAKSARADATIAVNTLVSSASSALYMALSNLAATKNTQWVEGKHSEIETFFGRLYEYQSIINNRLANLYNNTWD